MRVAGLRCGTGIQTLTAGICRQSVSHADGGQRVSVEDVLCMKSVEDKGALMLPTYQDLAYGSKVSK